MTQTFYIKVSAKKLNGGERLVIWNYLQAAIDKLSKKTANKIVCTEGTE